MKSICLYFQIHHPLRLKRYRFFDIGNDHYYYDDYTNESIINKIVKECYLPSNQILLELIQANKDKFKVSFSISGVTLNLFERYTPEIIDSFKQLADTGCVEFLAETFSHSLSCLKNQTEFKAQVKAHSQYINDLFGQAPKVFRNTELIYSDNIGHAVAEMGYKGMVTEGAKHILGWKSPNYLYCNALNPKLKLLMRNYSLSDDIAFRFSDQSWSEWPLTSEKFAGWLNELDIKEDIANVFMDYATFGEHQKKESGIFEFLKNLPAAVLQLGTFKFTTPSEAIKEYQPIAVAHVPHAISWANEERDISAWTGNALQQEAIAKLYELRNDVAAINNERINKDWYYLQSSEHFFYMRTNSMPDGNRNSSLNPFSSPYDAFINYMNVLSDYKNRIFSLKEEHDHAAEYKNELNKKDQLIKQYENEISLLRKQIYQH
ncbi:glycoside hydrolase family 57 protein [Carboxylicivirga taeanensis]|uniref:glycoside hydrolase family 57 protein n=1 Tax=Carboxylicivirga taeanensis TaxID=1416875 RepID=UPI003F6DE537